MSEMLCRVERYDSDTVWWTWEVIDEVYEYTIQDFIDTEILDNHAVIWRTVRGGPAWHEQPLPANWDFSWTTNSSPKATDTSSDMC